jgi:hypothetical protein
MQPAALHLGLEPHLMSDSILDSLMKIVIEVGLCTLNQVDP